MTIRSRKSLLPLAAARAIAVAAEQHALKRRVRVAIAILDAGGELLYFQRMDRVAPASSDVALAKAQHVLTAQRPTDVRVALAGQNCLAVVGISGLLPLAGGHVLQVGQQVVGAIGVSGAIGESAEERVFDGEIAAAGAAVCEHI